MASFVDLMRNDVWNETDIKRRLHAELRSEFPQEIEDEINRALHARREFGRPLTDAESANIARFVGRESWVAALGVAARSDALLLEQVMALEPSYLRLVKPALATPDSSVEEVDIDNAERTVAGVALSRASAEVLTLLALRNPAEAV